jgi:hypothetical protein
MGPPNTRYGLAAAFGRQTTASITQNWRSPQQFGHDVTPKAIGEESLCRCNQLFATGASKGA